jgi:transcriptional regulator with XRE-family HTH domain
MSNTKFDVERFYAALDATREARGLTWRAVAQQSGVAASTLTRIGQGKRPDVDGLSALLSWAGLDAKNFLGQPTSAESSSESLAQITALLRADKNLQPESAKMLEQMLKAAYASAKKKKE